MPDYSQMRVNPSSKPPKPTRPKDPPSKTQKDEFIIEGSGKAGKSGKGLSTKEVMDIADIAVKLFNSKKYPTLYDDETLRERTRTQGAPTLRMSFQPTYDGLELATDIASNPTPVGIGIAVAKQLLKLDIMGEVEEQIANTRQIQLHEEDRHRDIASAEQKKREIDIQRLQSKNKVVFGDLQKRLSSSLSVRTRGKVEVPKVTYDNLKKYLDPPKVFKEADNTRYPVLDKTVELNWQKDLRLNAKPNIKQGYDAVIDKSGNVRKEFKGWEKLIKFKAPKEVYDSLKSRNESDKNPMKKTKYGKWKVQEMKDAVGEKINLDFYSVEIESMPNNPDTGKKFTESEFTDYIRKRAEDFFTTDEVTLTPYDTEKDGKKWGSNNPLTAVMKFEVGGDHTINFLPESGNPDDLSVICSETKPNSWIFTPVQNPEDQQHPVTGNREFGVKTVNGKTIFYTQGADRLTGILDEKVNNGLNEYKEFDYIFKGGDSLWRGVMKNVSEFINKNGGKSKIKNRFSKRFTFK